MNKIPDKTRAAIWKLAYTYVPVDDEPSEAKKPISFGY